MKKINKWFLSALAFMVSTGAFASEAAQTAVAD
mgnify:FL=1